MNNKILVCVDNDNASLTIGNIYYCLSENEKLYMVINDGGSVKTYYDKSRFKTLLEIRRETLNDLLK
jgi:hypothetical protein